jgi:arylsulfatase
MKELAMNNKPNLLFIFTDEQRYDTMAAYGNTQIDVANLNRLAGESIVFERAYCTQPVCTPSRGSIVTGLYPHTHGCPRNNMHLAPDVPTLVELGNFEGYRTCYNGKWHLGDEVFQQHGFHEWISTEDEYYRWFSDERDRRTRSTYFDWLQAKGVEPYTNSEGHTVYTRPQCARLPEEQCKPTFQAEEACRFIEENRESPFVLYVNFLEPHMPFFGPRDDQYDPADMPLPPNFDHVPGPDCAEKDRRRVRLGQGFKADMDTDEPTEDDWRKLIARYWGLVSQVDAAVGTILEKLEADGLMDNTVIVFTSDHGEMQGSHQMVHKDTQYEEAVRIPLLVRIPKHGKTGAIVSEPISQVDLVPTLLDYMGQSVPETVEGQSWRPFLDGGAALDEEDVFIEWTPITEGTVKCDVPIRAIITRDLWKFNWRGATENELYDLNADPEERENLANRPEQRERVRDLVGRIKAWQKRTVDTLELVEPA